MDGCLHTLAKQITVHYRARDRCGHRSAVTAVFDDHRQRDARLFHRGESDEQRVITHSFSDLGLIVELVLPHREYLGSAGFAGDTVTALRMRRAVPRLPSTTSLMASITSCHLRGPLTGI